MAKHPQARRGRPGPPGPPGPPGRRGPRGGRGARGLTGRVGPIGIVEKLDREMGDVRKALETQLMRIAQIQQQLDELRARLKAGRPGETPSD